MSMDANTVMAKITEYTNIPPITMAYEALTILLSATTSYIRTQSYKELVQSSPNLVFDDIIIPSLQLVPSHIVFHPWTLWTSTFVETSPFQFISGLVIVYFGITFLESQWNPTSGNDDSMDDISQYLNSQKPVSETLKFTTVVITVSNLTILLLVSLINILSGTAESLNRPLQYGFFIMVLPISVVAKQLIPEANIKVLSIFKFRLKRLSLVLLASSLALSLGRRSLSPFLPAFVSFLVSWYYLRYIQITPAMNADILPTATSSNPSIPPQSSTNIRGDPSDTFALVEFFPEMIKPTLRPIFDGFYQVSVLLGIVRPWNDDDVDIGNLRSNLRFSGASAATTKTTVNQADSSNDERRKQIALKVLQQSVERQD